MASLEYLVRPFQSPNALGRALIPSTPQNTHEKATITWGATTALPNVINGISVQCRAQKHVQQEFPTEPYVPVPPIDGFNTGVPYEFPPPGDQNLVTYVIYNIVIDYSDSPTWQDEFAASGGWESNPDNRIAYLRADSPLFDTSEKDGCISDWDQFSGVGADVTSALSDFAADIHSGTVSSSRQARTQINLTGLASG